MIDRPVAGSNADLGTVAEIDAELRERSIGLDEALVGAKTVGWQYAQAKRAHVLKTARLYGMSDEKTSAAKEREAESMSAKERAELDEAQVLYNLALLSVRVGAQQLNAAQTRAAMLRSQMELDGGGAPSFPAERKTAIDEQDGDECDAEAPF